MDSKTPYTTLVSPVFDEDKWKSNDFWEVVEEDYEVLPLPTNPIIAQTKKSKIKESKKVKGKSYFVCCCLKKKFSLELWPSNQHMKSGVSSRMNTKEIKGLKECKPYIWLENLRCRKW